MTRLESDIQDNLYWCKVADNKGIVVKRRLYPFTSENISGYIKEFILKNKSLLTIGSSGDQAINAILHGCKDVTIYDIVPETRYYYFLKVAALLSLSKEEYLKFFRLVHFNGWDDNPDVFNYEFFNKLRPTLRALDYDSFLFFDCLFSSYSGKTIRRVLFCDDEDTTQTIIKCNNYLQSDSLYDETKSKIKKVEPSFIIGDIFDMDNSRSYDNIWLSNVPAWYGKEEEIKKLLDVTYPNLNDEGKMLFSYLFAIRAPFTPDMSPVYNIEAMKKILSSYDSSIIEFDGVSSGFHDKDGAIILTKTKK